MAREDFDAAVTGPEYDLYRIYTTSQDSHGHSSSPRATMPKDMFAQLGLYVMSPQFPEYTSSAAFIRDAVYHRLHFWATQPERDHIPAAVRQIRVFEVQARASEYREMLVQVDHLIEELTATVGAAIAAGDFGAAKQTIDEYEDLARDEFEDPHRKKILERVEQLRPKAQPWY